MDRESESELLGRRLAEIRQRAGFTQTKVAAYFSKPQSWVAKIEAGERNLRYSEGVALLELFRAPHDLLDPDLDDDEFDYEVRRWERRREHTSGW